MDSISKIKWSWYTYEDEISVTQISRIIKVHRCTVYRWISGIKEHGLFMFCSRYQQAKKGGRVRKIDGNLFNLIIRIRKKYRRSCGQKIQHILLNKYGIRLSVTTIYNRLREAGLLCKRRKVKSKPLEGFKGSRPFEKVQVDTVDLGGFYAFTAVDTYSKVAHVSIQPDLTNLSGKRALKSLLSTYPSIQHIQCNGGSEFKNEWRVLAKKTKGLKFRVSRPYKKNEQAFIECFNGSLRRECLGWESYRKKDKLKVSLLAKEYMRYFNFTRPHLAVKFKTPYEFVVKWKKKKSCLICN